MIENKLGAPALYGNIDHQALHKFSLEHGGIEHIELKSGGEHFHYMLVSPREYQYFMEGNAPTNYEADIDDEWFELYFLANVGYLPIQDDLERAFCDRVGEPGHSQCGWCFECGKPFFMCEHISKKEDSDGSL